jgi:hypothetical protein
MQTFTVTSSNISRSNVSPDLVVTTMDELFKLTGVKPVVTPDTPATTPAPAPAPAAPAVLSKVNDASVCAIGRARATSDKQILEASGFALKCHIFEAGTRVNEVGVENAKRMRLEYEAMPLTSDACAQLVDTVCAERRTDASVKLSSLQMGIDGRVSRGGGALAISERAFQQLMGRVSAALTEQGLSGLGGAGSYLRACPAELRARNVNHWLKELGQSETEVTLRYRKGQSGREIFAAVSPTYTSYDIDQIASAIGKAAPAGARSEVLYDGYKARVEVLFHSTVQPSHFVAGEIFRAGVIVSTDDTGGGSIRVSAVVWQNLCRNLIVIDRSAQETCRIRHVGDMSRLVTEFHQGFNLAMGKINHFAHAWDAACERELKPAVDSRVKTMSGRELREAIVKASIESVIKRDLVPVVGRKTEAVEQVFRAWKADGSGASKAHGGVNVAALANAFTRYAHETAAQTDPWVSDEIQEAAGRLVYGRELV